MYVPVCVCVKFMQCMSVGWTPAAAASVEQFQYFIKDIQRVLPAPFPSLPLPLANPWQAGVKCNSATLALQLFSLNVEQKKGARAGKEQR